MEDIISKIQKPDGSINSDELIKELQDISTQMDILLGKFNLISTALGEGKPQNNSAKTDSSKTISAVDIINLCEIFGNEVRLPNTQFSKKTYSEVKLLLTNAGGSWQGGKIQAFVFPFNPERVISELKNGKKINLQQDFQFFETPDVVADWLIMLAGGISENDTVLEPSAGRGAIIRAIHRACPSAMVECYELMPENREFLDKHGNICILGDDFTRETKHDFFYSKIIANPPFSNNQDIDHVRLMYERLQNGGILAAIISQHWKLGQEKKCVNFRNWLESVDAKIYDIDAGEFKTSGTTIATTAIVIKKNNPQRPSV